MKTIVSLFFILSMALTVSCGDDKKKKNRNELYQNQLSTFNAYYHPSKQSQVYYNGQWYQVQMYSGQQQLQQVYQATYQAIMSGSSQYPMEVHHVNGGYMSLFRVQMVGSLGGYVQGQIPGQQFPPQQQYPQQQGSSGVITAQSIQLF